MWTFVYVLAEVKVKFLSNPLKTLAWIELHGLLYCGITITIGKRPALGSEKNGRIHVHERD